MLRNDITITDLERLSILELRAEKYEKIGEQWEGEAYFEAYYRLSQQFDGITWEQANTLRQQMVEAEDDGCMTWKGFKVLRDGTLYAEAFDELIMRNVHMVIDRNGEGQVF